MTTATTSRHLPTPSISSNPNIQAGRALHLGQGMRGEATTWKVTLCIRAKRKNPTGASVGTGHVSGASLQGGTGDTQEAEAEPTAAALAGSMPWHKTLMHTLPVWGANLWKEPIPSPPTQAVALWVLCCWRHHQSSPHGLLSQQSQPPTSDTTAYPAGPGPALPALGKPSMSQLSTSPGPCRWPGTSSTNLAD